MFPRRLAARIDRLEKQGPAFPDHGHDVHVTVHVNLVQELVRVSLSLGVRKHPNEFPGFDQRDDLLKADPTLLDEPGVFLLTKGVVPLSRLFIHYMALCAYCQRTGAQPIRDVELSSGEDEKARSDVERLLKAASDVLGVNGVENRLELDTVPRSGAL